MASLLPLMFRLWKEGGAEGKPVHASFEASLRPAGPFEALPRVTES